MQKRLQYLHQFGASFVRGPARPQRRIAAWWCDGSLILPSKSRLKTAGHTVGPQSVGIWRVQEKQGKVLTSALASVDLDQCPFWSLPTVASMKPREERFPDKDEPATPRSSRLEEAHQIIEEYAEGLRQIIKKLRRLLN